MSTVEDIARRVAIHAYDEHVVTKQEFTDGKYGPPMPIESREDFQEHIVAILESSETICFSGYMDQQWRAADFYYHEPSNTMVIVPHRHSDEPTAYRPQTKSEFFDKRYKDAAGREQGFTEICNSIYELKPELAAAKKAEEERASDQALREAVEQRFQKERAEMQTRHTRELKSSTDPSADRERQARELQKLTEDKERDFERYKREREAARRLQEENRKRRKERQHQETFENKPKRSK